MNRLEGKVAVVTGANSGVGEATAKLFAAEGAKVVMAARRVEPLEAVAAAIAEAGGECYAVPTDIADPEGPAKLMEAAIEKYGKIDVLVNNAGVLEEGLKPIDRFTDEDLDWVIGINQKGTMRCMREATKRMEAGSIVNIASVAGAKGFGGAVYVSTKAAIIGVTKNAALRFQAEAKIRVNAICPGNIITPMTIHTDPAKLDPDMMGAMAAHSNLRAPSCQPEDVANIALFLASDESRALTGQIIVSDFGSML